MRRQEISKHIKHYLERKQTYHVSEYVNLRTSQRTTGQRCSKNEIHLNLEYKNMH